MCSKNPIKIVTVHPKLPPAIERRGYQIKTRRPRFHLTAGHQLARAGAFLALYARYRIWK